MKTRAATAFSQGVVVSLFIVAWGCGRDGAEVPPDLALATISHENLNPVRVEGVKVSDAPEAGLAAGMRVVGAELVLFTRSMEPPVLILDTTSGRVVRQLGKKGDGPAEFQGLASFSIRNDAEHAVWRFVALWRHSNNRCYLPFMGSDSRHEDVATWVRVWQAAGPRLEAIRLQELQRTTVADFVASMSDAFRAALLHAEPRLTSGLVEQQRRFAKRGM